VISNKKGSEAALVVFHNKWASSTGQINHSVDIRNNSSPLFKNLGLTPGNDFVIFKDQITSLDYIIPHPLFVESGLVLDLGAYQYHVFHEFSIVSDPEYIYSKIYQKYKGKGIPDLQNAYREIQLKSIFKHIRDLHDYLFAKDIHATPETTCDHMATLSEIGTSLNDIYSPRDFDLSGYIANSEIWLQSLLELISKFGRGVHDQLCIPALLVYGLFDGFRRFLSASDFYHLHRFFKDSFTQNLALEPIDPKLLFDVLNDLFHSSVTSDVKELTLASLTDFWFSTSSCRKFINCHEHNNTTWFNREQIGILYELSVYTSLMNWIQKYSLSPDCRHEIFSHLYNLASNFVSVLQESEYQEESFKRAAFK
jgi:hypothetical protein